MIFVDFHFLTNFRKNDPQISKIWVFERWKPAATQWTPAGGYKITPFLKICAESNLEEMASSELEVSPCQRIQFLLWSKFCSQREHCSWRQTAERQLQKNAQHIACSKVALNCFCLFVLCINFPKTSRWGRLFVGAQKLAQGFAQTHCDKPSTPLRLS